MSQRMEALDRANEVRSERARLRRLVADGEMDVIDLIVDPPEVIQYRRPGNSAPSVADLLTWQHRWGKNRASRFLSEFGITRTVLPQNLSFPSKVKIARALEENAEHNAKVRKRKKVSA